MTTARDLTSAGLAEASTLAQSPVVKMVFEQILAAVHTGQQLAVSRTPVREALLRLREIGVVEASPSRFTRVAPDRAG